MKMQKVIEKFGNKFVKEVDIKDYLFYHENKIINPELTISDYLKDYQKQLKSNIIIISVRKITKIIICPDCLYNTCSLEIENYGLHFYGCKYGHEVIKTFREYKDSQKINDKRLLYIKCVRCRRSYMEVEEIYKCLNCSKECEYKHSFYFCGECMEGHSDKFKGHKSIKYEDKNYICLDDYEYSSYCLTCKIDLCKICKEKHKNHNIIKYDDITPKIKERKRELEEIKYKIDKSKVFIIQLKQMLDHALYILEEYYNICKDIVDKYDSYNTKLRNYHIINTINSLEKSNKVVIEDLDKLLKMENTPERYLNTFGVLFDIYLKERSNLTGENINNNNQNSIKDNNNLKKQNKESEIDLSKRIDDLTEKLKKAPFILEKDEKIISIIFMSVDQKIHYSMICKNTDTINKLEPELYKEYPEFSKTENFFIYGGKNLDKSKKFEEYKINNGDIIILDYNSKDE